MESNSPASAQEQLDALATSRQQMLERIALPWREALAWAVVMNACMVALVAPIFLAWGWSLVAQGLLTVGIVVLAVRQGGRRERVKRPRLRVPGAWMVSTIALVALGGAFALAVYARAQDDAWLGGAALILNFAGYLAVYGGMGVLLRRQYARIG